MEVLDIVSYTVNVTKCTMYVLWIRNGCTMNVLWMFYGSTMDDLWLSLDVFWM